MIDLMFPIHMDAYDPQKSSGIENPGGGMATKLLSVKQALSTYYKVNVINSFADQKNDVLIIEPLTIRLTQQDFGTFIKDLEACKAKTILYCSEMEVCRWAPATFVELLNRVDIVTANTKYQEQLITVLSGGYCHPMRLCDPIDDSLFRPSEKKRRVFSAGRISEIKNSAFIVDVFREGREVWGDSIETAYFGSADLWGNEPSPEDIQIHIEIEAVVDYFEGGISRNKLASLFGESLVYTAKSTHDVYSSTHVEILASGCLSVGGGHPMYAERPGISGLKTVDEFVLEIQELLELSENQLLDGVKESRDYVLKHCGFQAFLNQFQRIVQEIL